LSRRFAPWRGVDSPPGQELLGVITSHGPSRESYRSSRKSRGSAEEIAPSAADAALSAEGTRNPQTDSERSRAVFQNAAASAGESSGRYRRRAVTRSGDGGGDGEPRATSTGWRRCHGFGPPARQSRAASDRAHSKPTPPHRRRNPIGEETAC